MNRGRKPWLGLVGLVALTVGLAACAGGGTDPEPPGPGGSETPTAGPEVCPSTDTTETIKIAMSSPTTATGPVWIADRVGAYEAAGLDVEFVPLSASEALPLLARGDIDIHASVWGSAQFNALDTGVDVKWIGTIEVWPDPQPDPNETPLRGLFARKDVVGEPGNFDFSKLEGARIASTTRGLGMSGKVVYDLLSTVGLDNDDVIWEPVTIPADAYTALSNGAVQLGWIPAPLEILAAADPNLVWIGGFDPGVPVTGLLAGPGILDRPDVGVRLIQVLEEVRAKYLDGDYRENPETVALLVDNQVADADTIAKSNPTTYAEFSNNDSVEAWMTSFQDWLIDQGQVEYTEPIDADLAIDNSFVETARLCAAR